MPRIEKKYRVEQGEFGSYRITQFGRCSGDQNTIKQIEEKCTRVFTLIQIPNSKGVVFKSLDGTEPVIIEVEPTTMGGRKYRCVKIYGRCTPFAPVQEYGEYAGVAVMQYEIVYQQVGDPNA